MHSILIVEDELNLRWLYKETLEEAGYCVITTAMGTEASKIIQTETIKLVVLDIQLPDVSGMEILCNTLTKRKDIPFIINTSYPTYKLDFRSWGADAYLCKSSDLSILTQTVAEILNGQYSRFEVVH
ncbi:MAG: response regulator [bacterium]